MTQQSAAIVRLPCDQAERRERQLVAAWEAEDRLEQQLRSARTRARALEREVGRDMGYFMAIGREKLERALRAFNRQRVGEGR